MVSAFKQTFSTRVSSITTGLALVYSISYKNKAACVSASWTNCKSHTKELGFRLFNMFV